MSHPPAYTSISEGLAALDRVRAEELARMRAERAARREARRPKRPGARGRVHGKKKRARR